MIAGERCKQKGDLMEHPSSEKMKEKLREWQKWFTTGHIKVTTEKKRKSGEVST